ncbi:hypothetical protein, partial [Kineococcus indalonis]|uniref:hypothetical protein n=1 Tax=Kineococcus indalonis TaxID=2696566 RepID=UPI0014120ABB
VLTRPVLALTDVPGLRMVVTGVFALAALFCYVDLLTVPPMSWALCAAAAGLVAHRRRGSLVATARTVLAAAVAWPVAFGFTWVSRWVIAALVQGPGVFSKVGEVSRFRLDGGDVSQAFGAGLARNWSAWVQGTATAVPVLVAAAAVTAACLVVAVRRHGAAGAGAAAVLAAPALVVPAWYCVLSNHSQIHAFFTYASLPAAVGVVVAAAAVAARRVPAGAHGRAAAVPLAR